VLKETLLTQLIEFLKEGESLSKEKLLMTISSLSRNRDSLRCGFAEKPELWYKLTGCLIQDLGESALNCRALIFVTNDLYKARVKDKKIYATLM